IYWAVITRNPASASLVGAVLGLADDSLAHLALGVNGIAKTLIGYLDASLGARMDADHIGIRWMLVLVCYLANRAIVLGFERFLLGTPLPFQAGPTLIAAAVNAVLAVILFQAFDRVRSWM